MSVAAIVARKIFRIRKLAITYTYTGRTWIVRVGDVRLGQSRYLALAALRAMYNLEIDETIDRELAAAREEAAVRVRATEAEPDQSTLDDWIKWELEGP